LKANLSSIFFGSFLVLGKLLVTTGYNVGSKKTEVFDLMNTTKSCKPLADYPLDTVQLAAGGLLNNSIPLICGGRGPTVNLDDCFVAGKLSSSKSPPVKLSQWRVRAAGSVFNGSTLWLTGGYIASNHYSTPESKSTEFIDMNGSRPGPDLPMPLRMHCVVSVNETTAIVIGGMSTNSMVTIYNFVK
jgi:hypothetical protein